MAEISIEEDVLVVTMQGLHKLYTLKNRIEVPLSHIRGASVDPGMARDRKGLRAPGMHIPWLVTAGTFFSDGERTFWDVSDATKTVVIELADDRFDRIVIGVDEPRRTVDAINAAIAPIS